MKLPIFKFHIGFLYRAVTALLFIPLILPALFVMLGQTHNLYTFFLWIIIAIILALGAFEAAKFFDFGDAFFPLLQDIHPALQISGWFLFAILVVPAFIIPVGEIVVEFITNPIAARRNDRARLRNGDIKIVYGYGDQDVWFEKGMSEKEWLQKLRFVRRMQGIDEAVVPGSRQPVKPEAEKSLS